jgi:hypothetical protein
VPDDGRQQRSPGDFAAREIERRDREDRPGGAPDPGRAQRFTFRIRISGPG